MLGFTSEHGTQRKFGQPRCFSAPVVVRRVWTRSRSGVFGAVWLKCRRKPSDMTLSGLPVYDAPNTDIIVHAPRGVALG